MSSWRHAILNDVCSFENGDRGSNYPSKDSFLSHGVPFVNAGDLAGGFVSDRNVKYISQPAYDRLGGGKFSNGDILFCLRGSLGKTGIVRDMPKGAIASSLVIIRPGADIDTRYLSAFLNSKLCTAQIAKTSNGLAQPNLSAASLKCKTRDLI